MKRVVSWICLMFILICPTALAATNQIDNGYYIKNYDVRLVANPDRSFDVTETIEVYFKEASHGITRDVSPYSSVEEVRLKNFQVKDLPFSEESYGVYRIGDPDQLVKGDVTYEISYTLSHYADPSSVYDYIYVNLIGTSWNTRIEQFSAAVGLPAGAVLNKYTITGGAYGSTAANDLCSVSVLGNQIQITGKKQLQPYEGLTINAELLEGAFPLAPVWQSDFQVRQLDVFAVMNEYADLTVTENYTAVANLDGASLLRNLSQYEQKGISKIGKVEVMPPGSDTWQDAADTAAPLLVSSAKAGETLTFAVRYTVAYANPQAQEDWQLYFMENSDSCWYDAISLTLRSPFDYASSSFRSTSNFSEGTTDLFTKQVIGNTLTARMQGSYRKGDAFKLSFAYKAGSTFARHFFIWDYLLPALMLTVLLTAFWLAFIRQRDPILTPPVQFYPPEGLNPAEIGYIIDNTLSGRDLTALIYYWASQGHLLVEFTGKDSFILHKKNELEASHPAYEKSMYRSMWGFGSSTPASASGNPAAETEEVSVSEAQLQGKFYAVLNTTLSGVRNTYRGEKALYRQSAGILAGLVGYLWPLLGMAVSVLAAYFYGYHDLVEHAVASMPLVVGSWGVTVSLSNLLGKRRKNTSIASIALLLFCLVLAGFGWLLFMRGYAGGVLPRWSAGFSGAALLLTGLLAPLIRRRTAYGSHLLELCLGFKNFLRTAEKDRLELLLADDPEYYYNILPYAQVLGVSAIWEKKFDGITLTPPSWSYSSDPTRMNFNMIYMMNHMSNSLYTVPVSAGRGISSGGGGFGGGGFSGGGSGGGGGGRW
ncbi:MAG: DUF2207 domain-containing protein [Negativicutes bacterium]|nr:DUF2207 domain-containing protein [Negativicutes bacterium]